MANIKIIRDQDDEVTVFSNFVTSSYWKLHQYALSLLSRSTDTADDLVQEAYTRVLDHIRRGTPIFKQFKYSSSYELETAMLRYMHVVIRHAYLDIVRHSYTNIASLDDQFGLIAALEIQDLDEYANVERVVVRREWATELGAYVDKLPKGMNAVMKLRLSGFSSGEIADRLSMSPGAVRVSASRATQFLRVVAKNAQSPLATNQLNHVNSREATPAIVNGIARLSEPYKIVVALRDIRHMSNTMVAHTLNRNPGTVKSQYHRGKKKLEALDSPDGSPDKSSHQLAEPILACLTYVDKLTDNNWREAIELHYVQGLSYTVAAKKLGRTEGTIKGWVSRAMKALQQYVNPQHALGVKKSPPHRRSELSEYIGELHATKYRHIMELYWIQLDNVPTIAAKLGIPEKDVRSRINQAQKYLRTRYSSTRDTQELKSAV